jgi:hypothetical protein
MPIAIHPSIRATWRASRCSGVRAVDWDVAGCPETGSESDARGVAASGAVSR